MFQPNPADLSRLCEILAASQLPDNQKQKQVFDTLKEYTKKQEYYYYLSYILSSKEFNTSLRRLSGLSLKSALNLNYETLQDTTKDFIKTKVLEAFVCEDLLIRRSASLVMTTIIFKAGFQSWPNLLEFLLMSLGSSNLDLIENTIDCIAKIIEDLRVNCENYDFFDASKGGGSSIDMLIPRLLLFCAGSFPENIRQAAVFCLNLCIFSMPPSLATNIAGFFEVLMEITFHSNEKLRLRGYQGLVSLCETRPDALFAKIDLVLVRIIAGMRDKNYEVARNAISFWPEFLLYDMDNSAKTQALSKVLQSLLENLLDCLQYADNDLMNLLPEDIARDNKSMKTAAGNVDEEEEDVDEYNPEDEKKELFGIGEFTIRRIAGQTMEKLGEIYRDEAFKVLQYKINEYLRHNDWKLKEAAILCIGALAEGCYEAIKPHLSFIILFLLQQISDKEPLIKTISCWTLSRYTSFIIENATQSLPNSQDTLIKVYLREILKAVMDNSATVQESACSAFSNLVTKAAHMLLPFLFEVFQVFAMVFEHYKGSSLCNLYGAIASIFESLESGVADSKALELLLPRILQKFIDSPIDDRNLCTLIECIISITNSLGKAFVTSLPALFEKSLKIIHSYLLALKHEDKKTEHEKRELLLRVIDLLSSILEILQQDFDPFIQGSNLYSLLLECLEDKDFQVRQFIFSFVGEIAKKCPKGLVPFVDSLVPILINNLFILPPELDPSHSYISICNNAVWAIGELAMSFPKHLQGKCLVISERIIQLMTSNKLQRVLASNFAKCLGRVALIENTGALASKLDVFAKHWCLIMKNSPEDVAKQQAFRGVFLLFKQNPQGFINGFQYVCEAFGSMEHPEEDLRQTFVAFVKGYKESLGEEWDLVFGRLPLTVKEKLVAFF